MSLPYLPPNKSKQQESEHAQKQMSKIIEEQPLSENSIENMSEEEYVRFKEDNESKRQALIEIESKKRKISLLQLYISTLIGVVCVFVGQASLTSGLSGWVAIIIAISGIALLVKSAIGPYGVGLSWNGVLSFFLAMWGIILGIGSLGNIL